MYRNKQIGKVVVILRSRMLYNINEVCNQRNIESIANEEMALEGYTLEIIKNNTKQLKGRKSEKRKRLERHKRRKRK